MTGLESIKNHSDCSIEAQLGASTATRLFPDGKESEVKLHYQGTRTRAAGKNPSPAVLSTLDMQNLMLEKYGGFSNLGVPKTISPVICILVLLDFYWDPPSSETSKSPKGFENE